MGNLYSGIHYLHPKSWNWVYAQPQYKYWFRIGQHVPLEWMIDQNQYLESENSHLHSGVQNLSMHQNSRLTWYLDKWVNRGPLLLQGGILLVWDQKEGWHFFLSYCTNKASFYDYLWGLFKASPIFFGVRGFSGIITSRFETTGLTLSNMEQFDFNICPLVALLFA